VAAQDVDHAWWEACFVGKGGEFERLGTLMSTKDLEDKSDVSLP